MKKVVLGFLMIAVLVMGAYGQMVFSGPTNDFKVTISGEMSGMMTLGLQDDKQASNNTQAGSGNAPGIFFPNSQTGDNAAVGTGKNGYYNNFDLVLLVSPISYVELYAKFKTRYQSGSPYLPFQLDSASNEKYEIKTDAAWARADVLGMFNLNIPLTLWLKVGKFNSSASHFNRVTNFGVDSVLTPMQTGTNQSFQIELAYDVPVVGPMALSFTMPLRLNEQLKEFYDQDSKDTPLNHFNETGRFAEMPIHLSLKMRNMDFSFMTMQIELLYALNGLNIRSGHSMGLGLGAKVKALDNLTIPIGLGVAFTEKNIDPFTGSSIENSGYESFYLSNGYSKADSYTLGLRQTVRTGIGVGVEYTLEDILKLNFNFGFTYSQIAHIYRDTLSLFSASIDFQTVFIGQVILGGGVVFGSLGNAEWKVKDDLIQRRPGVDLEDREMFLGHKFGLLDNIGFEIYTGLQMQNARFILGYNMNRGISMGNYIEALPDAQNKYRQADTSYDDGMFQRGGVFVKLVINL